MSNAEVPHKKVSQVRVLMVETGGSGGMYAYADIVCVGLSQAGSDVTVLTSTKWPDVPRPYTVQRCLVPINPLKRHTPRLFWATDRFSRVLINTLRRNRFTIKGHYDVVHIQTGTPVIDQFMLKSLTRHLPVILTVHDVKQHAEAFKTKHSFNRNYFMIPHRLIVHYDEGKRQMVQDWGIPAEKIDVIPHGINPLHNRPDMVVARKELGLPLGRELILFFGLIRDNKGLGVLLEALRSICESRKEVLLVIAGSMPRGLSFEKYSEMINRYDLSKNVRKFIHFIEEESVDHFFSACDIVVTPYLNFEAQSGVLLRAYAHKKPVIVSNVGGMGSLVNSDKVGLVVEANRSDELADAAVRVLSDLDGFHSRYTEEIDRKYSPLKIGEMTLQSYNLALSSMNSNQDGM